MKSKINHIEIKRLRVDYFFSMCVTVFGLMVLATFATLILHIFGNAIPLLKSPDINVEYSMAREIETRQPQNKGAPHSAIDLGMVQLQAQWLHLEYSNCALNTLILGPTDTSEAPSNSHLKQPLVVNNYPPDCNRLPLGLMGANNQYLATLDKTGLMEVFVIDLALIKNDPYISLHLQDSFMLPPAFTQDVGQYFTLPNKLNLHKWLAQWRVYLTNDMFAVTRNLRFQGPTSSVNTTVNSTLTAQHALNTSSELKAQSMLDALILTPIVNRKRWVGVSTKDEHRLQLLNLLLVPQQTFLLPDPIVDIAVSGNSLELIVVTQASHSTQSEYAQSEKNPPILKSSQGLKRQLHKFSLVNINGQFMLKPSFVINLPNRADGKLAEGNAKNAPTLHLSFDTAHNMIIAIDENGEAQLINSVTGEIANQINLASGSNIGGGAIAYARTQLVVTHAERFNVYQLNNLQGVTSFQTLFGENDYAAYPEPAYIWQTSVASDAQSPKFSIVPLLMGSIKASLLALIVALPLALGGAIYTAYFASPKVRSLIKPSIEMLEAIPSVVIGFIAAVWLAPFAEQYLISIFAVLVLLPFVVIVVAAIHGVLQAKIAYTKLAEWSLMINAMLLLLALMFIFLLSLLITQWSVNNDMNGIFEVVSGLTLSKTAIVVSLALGVAIAPTIYTLIDDALFEVPDGVKQASFALGATPVQTLTKVVLVVALPSIIAAVMLGFGRAFGETMIVLMVTGNTPIANWDLFSGLRTLTSNLAIELQEAQVESTLYYILFLTAGILFLFTFAVNTVAALLKRRMRRNS